MDTNRLEQMMRDGLISTDPRTGEKILIQLSPVELAICRAMMDPSERELEKSRKWQAEHIRRGGG